MPIGLVLFSYMNEDTKRLLQKSNLPDDTDVNGIEYRQMYESITDFYSDENKFIHPITCNIGDEECRTSIGYIPSKKVDIENIKSVDLSFSNANESDLKNIGLNTDNIWNGRVASINYLGDGSLEVAETDYYTIKFYSRLLMLESLESLRSGEMDFRKEYASDVSQFNDTPEFCTGASVSCILVGEHNDTIKALLGERSSYTDINSGLYSLAPSGVVRPDSLRNNNGFLEAAKMRFKNELFGYKEKGKDFIDKEVRYENIMNVWNLRNASLTVVFLFYIEDEISFNELINDIESNKEYDSIQTLDLKDRGEISDYINLDKSSPICIASLSRALEYMDTSEELPDIPYRCETDYN
jgi:hypothetical protein